MSNTSATIVPGDKAPDFQLPGINGTEIGLYRLSNLLTSGPVVLGITSATTGVDRRPVADLSWFDLEQGLDVIVVMSGSTDVHQSRTSARALGTPVLTDSDGRVGRTYGMSNPTDERLDAVFLIDNSRFVSLVQVAMNGDDGFDLQAIRNGIKRFTYGDNNGNEKQ